MKEKTTVGYDLKQENMKLVSILKGNQKYAAKESTFSYDPDAAKHKLESSLAQKCSVLSEWKPATQDKFDFTTAKQNLINSVNKNKQKPPANFNG